MKKIILALIFILVSINADTTKLIDIGLDALDRGDSSEAIRIMKEACTKNDMKGCSYAGTIYNRIKNKKMAYKYHNQACKGGYLDACSYLAEYYYYGYVVNQDKIKAYKLYSKACNNGKGNAFACSLMAESYDNGANGLTKDKVKAFKLYTMASNNGDGFSSYKLGQWYYLGGFGLKKDSIMATKLFTKSCNDNFFKSCEQLADMYYLGQEVKKDLLKSFQYNSKACNGNAPYSCAGLANAYLYGQGVKKNKSKAIELIKKSCKLGNKTACERIKKYNNKGVLY